MSLKIEIKTRKLALCGLKNLGKGQAFKSEFVTNGIVGTLLNIINESSNNTLVGLATR